MLRFAHGLVKKVVVADAVAVIANSAFSRTACRCSWYSTAIPTLSDR